MQSRNDATDISIHNRLRPVEGDGAYGSGGVAPDPGQGKNGFKIVWELSVILNNLPGGFMEVPCPAVIAETGPEFQDLLR
jgi:hypothetical protein